MLDFQMMVSEFALKNNVSELEIEDRPFGRYYSFSMLAGARRDACIANIRSYFNYKYEDEKVLIQSRLEEYLLFNDKCIFVEELAALSQRYAETYGGEEFQLLGVVLHHRKWRKLTDSKSGLVIYDKRQASSSGGWFVQWVLMDLATGSRGRGYEYGDSR